TTGTGCRRSASAGSPPNGWACSGHEPEDPAVRGHRPALARGAGAGRRRGCGHRPLRAEVDLADAEAVARAIGEAGDIDLVLNAAAYTAVDRAESEPDL